MIIYNIYEVLLSYGDIYLIKVWKGYKRCSPIFVDEVISLIGHSITTSETFNVKTEFPQIFYEYGFKNGITIVHKRQRNYVLDLRNE